MLSRFAKAKARINDHPIKIDANSAHICQPLAEEFRHVMHHIGVGGCSLHRVRFTLHMHHAERQASIRRCLQRLRAAETAHIIQETRTAPCRLASSRWACWYPPK